MPVIRGSNIDPSIVEDKIGQQEISEASKAQKKVIEDRLGKWKAFHDTPHGQVCAELAEPIVRHLNYLLSLSTEQLLRMYKVSLDVLHELRAEWRGERNTWYRIMYDQKGLETQLKEFEIEPEEKKAQWKTAKGIVKKILTEQSTTV